MSCFIQASCLLQAWRDRQTHDLIHHPQIVSMEKDCWIEGEGSGLCVVLTTGHLLPSRKGVTIFYQKQGH